MYEHLRWHTAKGDHKVGACMKMLERPETHCILKLPPKDESKNHSAASKTDQTSGSGPQSEIYGLLSQLAPLSLEIAGDRVPRQLRNTFVDRLHYLGYKRPLGEHIRYFVVDAPGCRLGCLLFESPTKSMPCRDARIGLRGFTIENWY